MKWLVLIALVLGPRVAGADPVLGHVLTAPTAWLPGEGVAVGTGGIDHRGAPSIDVGYGLGGLASIELETTSDLRTCDADPCQLVPHAFGRASFRIGARQDVWFEGQPAIVLGVRTGFGSSRASDAYVVASRAIGIAAISVGVDVIDARVGELRMGAKLRPTAGLELHLPQYPKTSLLGDVAYVPRFEMDHAALEWMAGWGVRYQALTWGSIELDVRHRQGEDPVGDATVLVRVNGVWDLQKAR